MYNHSAFTHVISNKETRTMLLLTLNRFHTSFWLFHCWLWTNFKTKKEYVEILVFYDVNIITRKFIDYVNTFKTNFTEKKMLNENYVANNLKIFFTTVHIRKLFWKGSGKRLKRESCYCLILEFLRLEYLKDVEHKIKKVLIDHFWLILIN